MRIIFYNNFHNGDIHYSREFVKDIMSKINAEYFYSHKNKPNVLKDIQNLIHINLNLNDSDQIIDKGDTIYINTWIGQQGAKYLTKDCSLYSNYNMFCDIFKKLSITIEEIEYYVPTINFEHVEKINIDNFIINDKKRVLFCNGPVYSGQCPNFSFDNIIIGLSNLFPNIDFILTSKSNIKNKNVYYTDDIIKMDGDLNEISYLSTKCDIIIGRASGPHAFTHIKNNLFNKSKTFISFSNSIYEGNWYNTDKCKQIWSNNYNISNVFDVIKKEIQKL